MKIGEFWKIQSVDGSPETQKTGPAGKKDEDFAAMLQDELSGAEGTDSAKGISELASCLSVPAVSGSGDKNELKNMVEEIDGIISKLQSLEQALQSGASAKQVDRIVTELQGMTENLQAKAGSMPDHQGLDDLTQEVNVASYMESVKWKRGDYL